MIYFLFQREREQERWNSNSVRFITKSDTWFYIAPSVAGLQASSGHVSVPYTGCDKFCNDFISSGANTKHVRIESTENTKVCALSSPEKGDGLQLGRRSLGGEASVCHAANKLQHLPLLELLRRRGKSR